MKIIHIAFSLSNGGKENMLVDIANEQQKQGNKVGIIIINEGIEQSIWSRISPLISTFAISRNPGSKSLIPFIKLFNILNFKFKADIIHCHDVHLGKLLRFICTAPRVLTIHGPGIEIPPMKHFNKLFAISNAIKSDVESRGVFLCNVVYNGIYTELIKQRKLNYLNGNFNIVLVKRLNHERKGHDLLIQAAEILIHRQGLKNTRIYLIGEGNSRLYIEQMISELHLNDYVYLLGNKTREWVYHNLCDYEIFVHPSRYEGFGLSLVEAMAAKVPVIASNIEGPAEILNNDKYGFLFENNSANDLAIKINEVFDLYNTGEINKKIMTAYNHCIETFDIKLTAKNYCASYLK